MEFEEWFLKVIGIADKKMGIQLGAWNADEFRWSWNEGLTPLRAVKRHYGLT